MKSLLVAGAVLVMSLGYAQAQTTYSADSYNLSNSGGNFTNGNGDSATFTTVNSEINSWWGLGIKSSCCNSYSGYGIVFDARAGSMFAQGKIGIGTDTPVSPLTVAAGYSSGDGQISNAFTVQPAGGSAYTGNGSSIYLGAVTNHGIQPVAGIWSALGGGGDGGINYNGSLVLGTTSQGNSTPTERLRVDPFGNVGIGTSSPGAKFDVAGSVKISGAGASMTFPDNSVQSTAWNGTTCGGDYAESVDVVGDRKAYEPGDVLVIDTKVEGSFVKSWEPYSTGVMGIYSTKPGLTGRRQLTPKSDEEIPMAMIGIVPTKVTTENGPIRPGDLLVTSSTPGYAMRGTDRSRLIGAVIGKAMGHLDAGKGVIEAGVTLQ